MHWGRKNEEVGTNLEMHLWKNDQAMPAWPLLHADEDVTVASAALAWH